MAETISSTQPVIELQRYWPYQLTVLADRIARRTAAIVRDHAGLNLSQWRVLVAIAEVPGRTAAEVVTITPMDKGIVSRATKALLEEGLVVRRASQADGRISHLYLTGKGEDLYQALRPRVEAVPREAIDQLDKADAERFSGLLDTLIGAIPDPR